MNNSNSDNKKIIEMVAVIGILLIFVGVATRIRQNSQVTLSKYATDTTNEDNISSETQIVDNNSSETQSVDNPSAETDTEDNPKAETQNVDNPKAETQTEDTALTMTQEEYDLFYYTDNEDNTSNVNILYYTYYDNEYLVQKGTLICDSEIAYDLLEIFYNLYKNKYPLTGVANDPAYIYSDECTEDYEINELRANNITYCKGKSVYINPLYNPYVSFDNEGNKTVIPDNEYASYSDRESNKGMYFIDREDLAYYLFTQKGFLWGGDMSSSKDYALFYIDK